MGVDGPAGVSAPLEEASKVIILDTMEDESWTGVILIYRCPNCGTDGMQKFVVHDAGYDIDKARRAAWKDRSPCKSCGTPLPENLYTAIDVTAASLEKLLKAGYPTPPVQ
jgi:predicted RNA-binding Zn-ribbon protein involved in translation (DUF1610 family)